MNKQWRERTRKKKEKRMKGNKWEMKEIISGDVNICARADLLIEGAFQQLRNSREEERVRERETERVRERETERVRERERERERQGVWGRERESEG